MTVVQIATDTQADGQTDRQTDNGTLDLQLDTKALGQKMKAASGLEF